MVFGTGAAVADVDGDGVLELLISNGESFKQPLDLFKAKIEKNSSFKNKTHLINIILQQEEPQLF